MTLRKSAVLTLGLAAVGMLAVATAALATHNLPTVADKQTGSLVTAYTACSPPGTMTHAAPLAFASCVPVQTSSAIESGTGAKAGGIYLIDVIKGPDVALKATAKDVRVFVAGPTVGAKYTGPILGIAIIRITDHLNSPPAGSAGTVIDIPFSAPGSCSSGTCSISTTANTVAPGVVVPGAAGNVEIHQVRAQDALVGGADASRAGIRPS